MGSAYNWLSNKLVNVCKIVFLRMWLSSVRAVCKSWVSSVYSLENLHYLIAVLGLCLEKKMNKAIEPIIEKVRHVAFATY